MPLSMEACVQSLLSQCNCSHPLAPPTPPQVNKTRNELSFFPLRPPLGCIRKPK
jgi:hypothetical protein